MNIIGNGVDIVDNKRIEKLIINNDFLRRIFTKNEIKISKSRKNKINFFAKRFAAKEAFVKALGTGFREPYYLDRIEIVKDKLGKPSIITHEEAKKEFKNLGITKAHVSLSDTENYVVAFVVLET